MARTKQSLAKRAKPHKTRTLKLRQRKNRLKASRRRARSRPHRRQNTGKK